MTGPDLGNLTTPLTGTPTGLTSAEAAARLQEYGPNEIRRSRAEPTWHKMLAQFQDPLVYLLLGAVAVSIIAWAFEGASGVPVDAVVIGLILVANAVLGYLQQARRSLPLPRSSG